MRHLPTLSAVVAITLLTACEDRVVAPDLDGEQRKPPRMEGFASRGEVRTGYILGQDGRPMRIEYEVQNGRAIFEGDIDVGPADSIPAMPEPLLRAGGPRYGVVRSSSSYRWTSGVVPYVINPSLPNQWRVTNAMAHVQATVAGVQFIPRTNESSYVYFTPGTGCSSPVGRVGGAQSITLEAGCTTGNAIHEIGHSLGMQHEHTRCDRDYFVIINSGNIESGAASNFTKQCSGHVDVFSYDEGSVMHYPTWAFGIGGSTTISSRRGLDHLMGQRNGLSQTDASTINWMYRPYAPGGVAVSYGGGTSTITWNASPGASYYSVELLVKYEENDYERGFTEYASSTALGTTTGLSIQDVGRTWTGASVCNVHSNAYGSADNFYYYEVYAHYPDGIVSWTAREPAEVGPC